MFGYIALNAASLQEEAARRYRTHYCGLCRTLKEKFGFRGQMTLSNDMTFLVLLLHSLYEPESREGKERCALHPIREHPYSQSAVTDYAADMNVLLSYYKLRDNEQDDRDRLQGLYADALQKAVSRIGEKYPEKCRVIRECLQRIGEMEKQDSRDVDGLCNLSGRMLGEIFAYRPDDAWTPLLRGVGEGLGRFIYFMDAYEDLKEDQKKGRFNPLVSLHGQPDYEGFCEKTLNLLIAEATEAFELLPLEENLDLMRCVLYDGVWIRYRKMHEKEKLSKE